MYYIFDEEMRSVYPFHNSHIFIDGAFVDTRVDDRCYLLVTGVDCASPTPRFYFSSMKRTTFAYSERSGFKYGYLIEMKEGSSFRIVFREGSSCAIYHIECDGKEITSKRVI